MKRTITEAVPILLLVFTFSICEADAQYVMRKRVIGTGAVVTANTNYAINGTLGQAGIGVLSAPDNKVFLGFWYTMDAATAVDQIPGKEVSGFALGQNYPNPVSVGTVGDGRVMIEFSVPITTNVRLELFSMIGQRIGTLAAEEYAPGSYRCGYDARELPAGTYFYRLSAEGRGGGTRWNSTRTMVVVK